MRKPCACQARMWKRRVVSEAMHNTTTQLVLVERRTAQPFSIRQPVATQIALVNTKQHRRES